MRWSFTFGSPTDLGVNLRRPGDTAQPATRIGRRWRFSDATPQVATVAERTVPEGWQPTGTTVRPKVRFCSLLATTPSGSISYTDARFQINFTLSDADGDSADLSDWIERYASWTLTDADGTSIALGPPGRDPAPDTTDPYAIAPADDADLRALDTLMDAAIAGTAALPITLTIDDQRTDDDAIYTHALVRIPAFGSFPATNLWTGEGNVTVGGVEYTGTTIAGQSYMSVEPVEQTLGTPDVRARVRLGLAGATARRIWQEDPGPLLVTLGLLESRDGVTWEAVDWGWSGYTSDGPYQDGVLSVELETWTGDVGRPSPKMYSHESHTADHPGDLFFEFMRGLASGQMIRQPP